MKTILPRLIVIFLFISTASFAQKPAIFSTDGKAIRGYDPVAYFTDGKPVMGDSSLTYMYQDVNWVFASREHLDMFKADPAKYLPQYGGYCAFGMSRGYKASTEPDAWTITDGKLYLNYNQKVRTEWAKDQTGYIQKADQNWPEVKLKK
ncbi:YHS domain-containing (seleno)protein [Spirosoma sp. SC4-14]|uniref:YHS domain-containing (seleno)protein n=1 Tax=Spirosoma sp. SC4-14 TaxID=3128900 RepID=UPI0030D32301